MIQTNEEEQLKTIRESRKFVILLIYGIIISLYNLNAQEKLILCGTDECEAQKIKDRQWISSTVVFSALIYFYCLTGKTAAAAEFCDPVQNNAYTASAMNLVAGMARLVGLLEQEKSGNVQSGTVQDETEL